MRDMIRHGLCLALVAWGGGLAACVPSSTPLETPPLTYSIETPWEDIHALPPPGTPRVLVTNSLDDTLSVLELSGAGAPEWKEFARIPVGLNPVEPEGLHHVAGLPSGEAYFVGLSYSVPGGGSGPHGAHGTGTADGYCLKVDARDNRRLASVRVDRNPGDLIVSGDGSTVYMTHFDLLRIAEVARRQGPEREMEARLAVLDARTLERKAMVSVCPAPHAVRLSPDERRAYVACWSDEVAVVRLDAEGYPVTRIKVAGNAGTALTPRHQPYALTVSPTTGAVWVSSLASRTVHYLDAGTLGMRPDKAVYGLPGPPMFGHFSRDGRTLYLPVQETEVLAFIDAETSTVRKYVSLASHGCVNAHQALLTPDERQVLVVCEGNHREPGTLHSVEVASGTVLSTVNVGLYPDAVAILRSMQ